MGDEWANLQQGDTKGKKKTSPHSSYGIAEEGRIEHSDSFEQDWSNSIANALELP